MSPSLSCRSQVDPRFMTLTISTSGDIPSFNIDSLIHQYTSTWRSKESNTPAINYVAQNVPTASPTGEPTPPPHHRWKRNSKNNRKRRRNIHFARKAVFHLPNGTFPGGWFYGVPDYSYVGNMIFHATRDYMKHNNTNYTSSTWLPDFRQIYGPQGRNLSLCYVSNKELSVFVEDSVERGVGYVAGDAPTPWGLFPNETKAEREKLEGNPLSGVVSLMVMKEVGVI